MSHSLLAPSGAHKWMVCPGSLRMEQGLQDTAGFDAAEGTAAHAVAAEVLQTAVLTAHDFIGHQIEVGSHRIVVDEEMARYVQTYVDTVRAMSERGALMVEQRVDFSHAVDVAGSTGTADAIVLQERAHA